MVEHEYTPAQVRVLRFLAAYPTWHALIELDQIRLLESDDVLCIPSLIERHLVVKHRVELMVRITPAGQAIAEREDVIW